jgi:hypothetical protein
MTPHVKLYLRCTGYGIDDCVPCEMCGKKAVDIHHIHGRGKGKNVIGNLIALCRRCHDTAHGISKTYVHPTIIQIIHDDYLKTHQ